ncbi:unnamed protein product [Heterobilharzia americana]|nr:unnamed protein product [Heterobilharzia americana]
MIDSTESESVMISVPKLHGSNQGSSVLKYICQFVLSQHSRIYSGMVDYIDGTSLREHETRNKDGTKAVIKDNCSVDGWRTFLSTKSVVTIETLIVGENCLEHCGDNKIPVYIMEQWIVQLIPQNFKERGISVSGCQLELIDYLETSP